MRIELYREYSYKAIEQFASEEGLTENKFGNPDLIGEGFIVLNHPDKDVCYSFMLIGFSEGFGYSYKLIYVFN